MRKITEQAAKAFAANKNWRNRNTEVSYQERSFGYGFLTKLFLHGNTIAEKTLFPDGREEIKFSLAGWNTPTTRERLKAVGVRVSNIKDVPHYNGKEISETEWISVDG